MSIKIVDNPKSLNVNGENLEVVQSYGEILKRLLQGKSVVHWEGGNSLHPIIRDMEYCKILPIYYKNVKKGMCVFCELEDGTLMVHRVNDIITRNDRHWFQIGDTWGNVFGWSKDIFGLAEPTNIFQSIENFK